MKTKNKLEDLERLASKYVSGYNSNTILESGADLQGDNVFSPKYNLSENSFMVEYRDVCRNYL